MRTLSSGPQERIITPSVMRLPTARQHGVPSILTRDGGFCGRQALQARFQPPAAHPALRDGVVLRYSPLRFLTASVSCGTTTLRSPTMPRSQKPKIGASLSLLMAMINPAVPMPALCCTAPEMPQAM